MVELYGKERAVISLKIDAGTSLSSHVVCVVIDSPPQGLKPLVWNLEPCSAWGSDDYAAYLTRIISEIGHDHPRFTIAAVVHDRLAAQERAVADVLSGAFRNKGILDIPCFNHMVNLVFADCHECSEAFNRTVQSVLRYQRVLRTSSARRQLKTVCPSIPKTRWNYVVDLLLYLSQNKKDIEHYIKDNIDEPSQELGDDGLLVTDIPTGFEMLLLILKPLHDLSLIFEHRGANLRYVLPLCRLVLRKWKKSKEMLTDEYKGVLRMVAMHFLATVLANSYD